MVNSLAMAFRLILDTIILVSYCGTLAIPEGGKFTDVDPTYMWTVEGEKSTANRAGGRNAAQPAPPVQYAAAQRQPDCWRPHSFAPSRSSGSRQVGEPFICETNVD